MEIRAWSKSGFTAPKGIEWDGTEAKEVIAAKAIAKVNGLSLANIHKDGARLTDSGDWVPQYVCTIAKRTPHWFVAPMAEIRFEIVEEA